MANKRRNTASKLNRIQRRAGRWPLFPLLPYSPTSRTTGTSPRLRYHRSSLPTLSASPASPLIHLALTPSAARNIFCFLCVRSLTIVIQSAFLFHGRLILTADANLA